MANTVNNLIPLVIENVVDIAASVNLALNTIDAITQVAVLSIGANAAPAAPAEGDRHIVGTAPSGAWAGNPRAMARYEQAQWRFYQIRMAVNLADNQLYVRGTGEWTAV